MHSSFPLALIFLAILVVLDAVDSALVVLPASALMFVMMQINVPLMPVFLVKEETDAVTPLSLALMAMPALTILAIVILDANTLLSTAMEEIHA
jgi:hypothetical protein